MCVVLYGAVEHWLSGGLVNVGDDDDDDNQRALDQPPPAV